MGAGNLPCAFQCLFPALKVFLNMLQIMLAIAKFSTGSHRVGVKLPALYYLYKGADA